MAGGVVLALFVVVQQTFFHRTLEMHAVEHLWGNSSSDTIFKNCYFNSKNGSRFLSPL